MPSVLFRKPVAEPNSLKRSHVSLFEILLIAFCISERPAALYRGLKVARNAVVGKSKTLLNGFYRLLVSMRPDLYLRTIVSYLSTYFFKAIAVQVVSVGMFSHKARKALPICEYIAPCFLAQRVFVNVSPALPAFLDLPWPSCHLLLIMVCPIAFTKVKSSFFTSSQCFRFCFSLCLAL